MLERNHAPSICVSSSGSEFMAAMSFSRLPRFICEHADAELEARRDRLHHRSGCFSNPKLPTRRSKNLPLDGMTVEQFFTMNKSIVLSVEKAGAGFAAAVVRSPIPRSGDLLHSGVQLAGWASR